MGTPYTSASRHTLIERRTSSPLLAVPTLCMLLATSALAEDLTFDGELGPPFRWAAQDGGTTNWDPDQVPTGADDCTVPEGMMVEIATPAAIANTLSVAGSITLPAFGALTLASSAQIQSGVIGSRLFCPGLVEFTGDVSLPLATLAGGGTFRNTGTLTVTGPSVVGWNAQPGVVVTLENLGSLNVGEPLSIQPASVVTNDGTLELMDNLGGSGSIVNRGTIQSTGSGIRVLGSTTQESGALAVSGGELWVNSSNQFLGGTITSNAPGILRFNGVGAPTIFDGTTSISGDGLVFLSAGPGPQIQVLEDMTWSVGDPFDPGHELVLSASLDLEAEVTNTGRVVWTGGNLDGLGALVNGGLAALEISGAGRGLGADLRNDNGEVLQLAGISRLPDTDPEIRVEGLGTWILTRGNIEGGVGLVVEGLLVKRDAGGVAALPSLLDVMFSVDGGELRSESSELIVAGDGTWTDATIAATTDPAAISIAGGVQQVVGTTTIEGEGHVELGTNGLQLVTMNLASGSTLRNEMPSAKGAITQDLTLGLNLQLTGLGTFVNAGGAEVDGSALDCRVENEAFLLLAGAFVGGELVNVGTVRQTGTLDAATGEVENSGTWEIESPGAVLGVFVNTAGGVLRGVGPGQTQIAALRNEAGASVIGDGELLVIGTEGLVENAGTITAASGAITLAGEVLNTGAVIAEPGATVTVNAALPGGSALESGTWLAFPGGTIDFADGVSSIGSSASVSGGTTSIPALDGLESVGPGGTLRTTEDSTFAEPLLIEPDGVMEVEDDTSQEAPLIETQPDDGAPGILGEVGRTFVPADGPVAPATIVTSQLTNGGRLRLGRPGEHGTLRVVGTVVQTASGEIAASIGGSSPGADHDQLHVEGDLALDGTLAIDLDPGFEPEIDDTFVIVEVVGGTITGALTEVTGPGRWEATVDGTTVLATYLGADLVGDVDGDGVVGPFDLSLVLAQWGTDGTADLNGDGTVDGADLAFVLGNWTVL